MTAEFCLRTFEQQPDNINLPSCLGCHTSHDSIFNNVCVGSDDWSKSSVHKIIQSMVALLITIPTCKCALPLQHAVYIPVGSSSVTFAATTCVIQRPEASQMAAAIEREAVYNYSYVFSFEKDWNESEFLKYMLERWTDSFVYCAIYVVVVFGGQVLMKTRPRYDLRPLLALWSGALAIFSIAGTIRTLPELVTAVGKYSLQYSICVPTYFKGVTGFWSMLFTVSKVYELGDTVFIVLRKQPLIFLHWYHHITVLLYVWYSYTDHTAPGRWFMVMNYIVHSVMYSYYAVRALRFRVPKWISAIITSLQLAQMIVGVAINIWIYQIKARGEFCQQTYENLHYSSMMYFSYFILFAHFFYTTYILEKPKGHIPVKSEGRDKKHA